MVEIRISLWFPFAFTLNYCRNFNGIFFLLLRKISDGWRPHLFVLFRVNISICVLLSITSTLTKQGGIITYLHNIFAVVNLIVWICVLFPGGILFTLSFLSSGSLIFGRQQCFLFACHVTPPHYHPSVTCTND